MYKLIFSVFIVVIVCDIGFSYIKSHKRQTKRLIYSLKKARVKAIKLKRLLKKAKRQSKQLLSTLREYKNRIAIRYEYKHGYQFEYYDDGTVIYTSDKGIGIKIDDKKLFIKKDGLSYSLEDEFRYTEGLSKGRTKIKNIYLFRHHFWMTNISYGLSKLSHSGNKLYKYHKILYPSTKKQEKLTILNNSVTIRKLNHKSIIYYNFSKNKTITVLANKWIKYSLNKNDSYTYFTDGNINISPSLESKIKADKGNIYLKKIVKDFPKSNYAMYVRVLLKKRVPLNKPYRVYLAFINHIRDKYNLKPLKPNLTLNTMAKKHGQYILKHKPKNLYLQSKQKAGYFGRTTFQRRKHFDYTNKVSELIVYGNNHIRQLIKNSKKDKWMQSILDPRAIHFGYYNIRCKGLKGKSSFSIMLIGRQSKLMLPHIIYYKPFRLSPTTNGIRTIKYMGFCTKPKVDYRIENSFLLSIFVYDRSVKIQKVLVSLSDKRIDHKIVKNHSADQYMYTIYAKKALKAGRTYSINILGDSWYKVRSHVIYNFRGYRYLFIS